MRRSVKQGRKPGGLGKPNLIRFYEKDEKIMELVKEKLGYLYNENELVRSAVHVYLRTVYTELFNT